MERSVESSVESSVERGMERGMEGGMEGGIERGFYRRNTVACWEMQQYPFIHWICSDHDQPTEHCRYSGA